MAKVNCEFYSDALKRQVNVGVFLPEEYGEPNAKKGHPIEKDFPVLYLLHGYNSDFSTWERMTQIGFLTRDLPLAIVMPSAYNSFYVNGKHSKFMYYDFCAYELPEKMKSFFNISTKREDSFIGGLSLGGYGAMKIALSNPDKFSYCFSLSGVIDIESFYKDTEKYKSCILRDRYLALGSFEEVKGSDDDIFALVDKLHKEEKVFPKLFLACGENDPALPYTRGMKKKLESLGVPFEYKEEAGKHDWIFWNRLIQDIFKWLPLEKYSVKERKDG